MNKTISGLVLGVAFATSIFVCGSLGTYSADCTVKAVEHDEVTLTDARGEEWVVYADDLAIGDQVVACFRDMDTSTRKDDQIYAIKPHGYKNKLNHIATE